MENLESKYNPRKTNGTKIDLICKMNPTRLDILIQPVDTLSLVFYILKLSKGRLFVHEVKSAGNSWMLIEVLTLPDSPEASLACSGRSTYDRFKNTSPVEKKAPVDFEWTRKDRI